MALIKLEREVITDSMLKIQSIQTSLNHIDDAKLINADEIHSCLKSANKSFRTALKDASAETKRLKR